VRSRRSAEVEIASLRITAEELLKITSRGRCNMKILGEKDVIIKNV
jgi:hypothetical protein